MDVKCLCFDNEKLVLRIEQEYFDERTNTFIDVPATPIRMEHSLYTISKWESKHHKSFFLTREKKTQDEIVDYMYTMIQEPQGMDKTLFEGLITNKKAFNKIYEYIEDSMTATYFRESSGGRSSELVTSELLYYQMISFRIPVEFEHWHINRLLALIKVFSIKNQPPKKRSMMSIMQENDAINEARKKKYHTKG